jgi:hypothetical protein
MAHALAADGRAGDFDAAPLAGYAAEANVLILATGTLPVFRRTKDSFTEQAISLRAKAPVVDGLWLGDLAIGQ